jgi:hypothetical protein
MSRNTKILAVLALGLSVGAVTWFYLGHDLVRYIKIHNM